MTPAAALEAAVADAERGAPFHAMARLRDAVRRPESLGERWAEMVMLAARLNDDDTAAAAARRLYAETPPAPMTAMIVASAVSAAGRADEAAALLVPWAEAGKLPPADLFRLARMLGFAHQLPRAQSIVRGLISNEPANPFYWEFLSQTKQFAPGDSDIDAMRRVAEAVAVTRPSAHAAIHYALAKAYVDVLDDAAAARAIEAATAAQGAIARFDADSLERSECDATRAFPEGEPPPHQTDIDSAGRPVIFVLGPPRSGTTLIEQILAAHPDVQGGGELKFMWLVSREIGHIHAASVANYVQRRRAADPKGNPWDEMARRYLDLGAARFGVDARFTDKLLSNHYRVGFVRHALPCARIIRCRRDPLDIAWSCWRTNFDVESIWSCWPDTIARFIASYERLMDAWSARYPGFIVEVEYETLVRTPDLEIPRLQAACSLSDDPATRRPEDVNRPVSTSSFAQIREPISAARVGASAAFAIATRPLREALERVGLL